MEFESSLRAVGFTGDIDVQELTLDTYSQDASLFVVRPSVVVYPKTREDISILMRWASKAKRDNPELSLTVRAAGTCMSGGPLGESVIVDVTRYLNRIGDVDTENRMLVTEPGAYYRDFEKKTLEKGLIYPSYPASKALCAMGGIVGNNGAGEKTLKYGKAQDYVASLKIILTDGNEYTIVPLTRQQLDAKMAQGDHEGSLYKSVFDMVDKNYEAIMRAKPQVSKNSAGYLLWNVWNRETGMFDLSQLIMGSQGTLGIVTEITFKLVPVQPVSNLLVIFMNDTKPLAEIVNIAATFKPTSIESFDQYSFKLAFKFFTDFIKQLGLFGAARLGLRFIPEVIMLLRGKVPNLILMIEIEGQTNTEVKAKLSEIQLALSKFPLRMRIQRSGREAEKYWRIRRESFNLLRKHVKGLHTAPFIDDIVVPVESLPEFLPRITAILDRENFIYTIAGHAGNGNFHIIPLMDFKNPETVDAIMRISDEVYDLVLSYGGSITAEHNDGIIRTPFLAQQFGPFITGLFKQTKALFDPQNILNPGKKVGGTKEYLKAHIRKD
jgi:FAD/FMN-containing dehydrogenase